MKAPRFLCTEDESGRPHVVRLDEFQSGMHWQRSHSQICPCNPRIVDGVIVHRQMTRGNLYAPWDRGGH